MDDYSGLAARVAAGVGGVRGCLILSRDGLVLGAHPGDDETVAKPSWLRFAMMGEPERSFVEFADQTWVYVNRGPYAAFAVADAGIRPGLVIDQLEQALLTAEESRTRRDGLRAPEGAPAAGPRTTTLHPAAPSATPAPVVVPAAVDAATDRAAAARPPAQDQGGSTGGDRPGHEPPGPRPQEAPEPVAASTETPVRPPRPETGKPEAKEPEVPKPEAPRHEAPKLMTTPVTPKREPANDQEGEVDRVLLAQEFSGLLQDLDPDDEGGS